MLLILVMIKVDRLLLLGYIHVYSLVISYLTKLDIIILFLTKIFCNTGFHSASRQTSGQEPIWGPSLFDFGVINSFPRDSVFLFLLSAHSFCVETVSSATKEACDYCQSSQSSSEASDLSPSLCLKSGNTAAESISGLGPRTSWTCLSL